MATRRNVETVDTDTEFAEESNGAAQATQNDDDYPEEFRNDDTTPVGVESNGSTPGLSDEEIDEFQVDDARDERERKKFITPQGDWIKTDKFNMTKAVRQDDSEAGDISPDGRTFFNFFGQPEVRLVDGIDFQPTLFFSVSPDFREDQYKDNGQGDKPYKLWTQAKDLYIAINGRKWKSAKDILLMLKHDSYTIKTGNYDGKPNVQFLKKTQTNRRR